MSVDIKCKLCGHEPGLRLAFEDDQKAQEFLDMYMCVQCDEKADELIKKLIKNE